MDASVRVTMKDAASCDNHCELQNFANSRFPNAFCARCPSILQACVSVALLWSSTEIYLGRSTRRKSGDLCVALTVAHLWYGWLKCRPRLLILRACVQSFVMVRTLWPIHGRGDTCWAPTSSCIILVIYHGMSCYTTFNVGCIRVYRRTLVCKGRTS